MNQVKIHKRRRERRFRVSIQNLSSFSKILQILARKGNTSFTELMRLGNLDIPEVRNTLMILISEGLINVAPNRSELRSHYEVTDRGRSRISVNP